MQSTTTRRWLYLATLVATIAVALVGLRQCGERQGAREDGDGEGEGLTARAALDTATIRRLPLPLAEYLASCDPAAPLPDADVEYHARVVQCTDRLMASVEMLFHRNSQAGAVLEWAFVTHRDQIREVARNPGSSFDTSPVRSAMNSTVVLMAHLWDTRYRTVPGLTREVAQARRAARRVNPEIPVGDQRDAVEDFLDRAGNAALLMALSHLKRGEE